MTHTVATTAGIQAREGKVYCCCVLDTCSRRIVGWSIDSVQDAILVVNALDMAIKQRSPNPGRSSTPITARSSPHGLSPNESANLDSCPASVRSATRSTNAMMESFWSSMQIELLDRKRWRTRLALTNAIFDYIEVFYNRRRRHSQLDYMTPAEFELSLTTQRTA